MDMRILLKRWAAALAVAALLVMPASSHAKSNTAGSRGIRAALTEASPQLVIETGGHQALILQLIFTADGRELISVSHDKTIRVWSVSASGKAALARTIRGQIESGRAGSLWAAALSPPDAQQRHRWLAVGGILAGSPQEQFAIRLHDYASGDVHALLPGHRDVVLALAFSPDGRWLASASKDKTVRLWDMTALRGGNMARAPLVLRDHTDAIYDLAWSASGDRLASASYDHRVGLWNTASLAQGNVTLIDRLRGHTDQVRSVAFHPSGEELLSGGKDATIRRWRARDGKSLKVFAKAKEKVSGLSFAPDGRWLLTGNLAPPKPRKVTLYAYPSGKRQRVFTGHDNTVFATAFHPRGKLVASAGGDQREILLWRPDTGDILSRLEGEGRAIEAVGFSADGRFIGWGHTNRWKSFNDRGPLQYWFELPELQRAMQKPSSKSIVRAREKVGKLSFKTKQRGSGNPFLLSVRRGGRQLAAIKRDKTRGGHWHSAYTFTPDGDHVLTGGQNGLLELYDIKGKRQATLVGHTGEIQAVAVSTDGRWALSGSNDQTLSLWPLEPRPAAQDAEIAPALTLFPTVHGEWIAWTPDGYFAASPRGSELAGYSINQGPDAVAKYVSMDQLYEEFYRPDRIHERLQGKVSKPAQPPKPGRQRPLQTRPQKDLSAQKVLAQGLPPQVIFVGPASDVTVTNAHPQIRVQVVDQGGGIGRVVWKIDGVTVGVRPLDARLSPRPTATGVKAIELTQQLALAPGSNVVEAIAYTKRHNVASAPVKLNLTLRPTASVAVAALPKLPAIAEPKIPTTPPPPPSASRPQRPSSQPKPPAASAPSPIDLHLLVVGIDRYRDRDLLLRFAVNDGKSIIQSVQTTSSPLFRQVHVTQLFDDQATTQGLEAAFAKVAPTVAPGDVFVLYIAGHGVTRDGRYYFLPQDFRYVDDAAIHQHGISQDHFQRWLASIPARKSLILVDTCESGSLTVALAAMRGMAKKTAVAKLTRATGRATIVASTAQQPALEGYEGHGVFTYALLQGLRDADAKFGNRDGYIGLFELASYVNDQVPALTMKAFSFEQIPQVNMMGTDFPIGVSSSKGS